MPQTVIGPVGILRNKSHISKGINMTGSSTAQFSMGRRWLIFCSVFFLGVLTSFGMFKAPTMFTTEFTAELGFTEANIGWVMSMFTLIGAVLAFPAGGIFAKLGAKKSLVITAVSLIIGAVGGALATNAAIMLATRFIEGIGMGLISVVGPAAVASIIPARKQGLAMGIWSVWFPAGVVLAMNITPMVYALAGSWRANWWLSAILAAIALVFIIAVYVTPPQEDATEQQASSEGEHMRGSAPLKLKPDFFSIIMIALAFGCWNVFNAGAIGGFYPSYLADVQQLDTQLSGTVSSVTNILVLILGPVSGIVADKFNIHKGFIVFGMFGAALLLTFAFGDNMALVWVFVIAMSFCSACCATGVFSSVPLYAKDPAKIGLGMATVAFFQNLGGSIGSAAFGGIAASLGWNMASLVFCVPIAIVGGICAVLIRSLKPRDTFEDITGTAEIAEQAE